MYCNTLRFKYPHFSVFQWNQLNSSLATTGSFPKTDPKNLEWEFRKPLIEEILKKNMASIICLEEVDQIEFYSKFFEQNQYKIIFDQKHGGTGDFILIAYNPKILCLDCSETIRYYDQKSLEKHSQFALFANFALLNEGKRTEKTIYTYATHLKAKNFEETRKLQVSQLMQDVEHRLNNIIEKERNNVGIVVCGDFNAEPDSDCVQMVEKKGGFSNISNEFDFTTFKIREKEYCRVIDYIFFSRNLNLICNNTNLNKKEIGQFGLPNEKFPSDHLNLLAIFGLP